MLTLYSAGLRADHSNSVKLKHSQTEMNHVTDT